MKKYWKYLQQLLDSLSDRGGFIDFSDPGDLISTGKIIIFLFKSIRKEFSKRKLSRQEKTRGEKMLKEVTKPEIDKRLGQGECLRNDGFFDKDPTVRSDAHEIAEAIMLKCQREPQEKKIPYMGYLLANIFFESNISADMGHQLIKAAEELTYRQLCILKLSVERPRFDLRNQDYQGYEEFSKELYQVLQECHDLCLKNFLEYEVPLTFSGKITVDYRNLQPNKMIIKDLGKDLFQLMQLSSIPDEDIKPIAEVLK